MAKIMGMDTNLLILVQYIYELSSFCTSILAADPSGMVIHVRNLDFAFADLMRNLTYEGWFYRNETLLFKSGMFAGLNGVYTGVKPGFSISLNTRKPSHRHNLINLIANLGATTMGRPQVSRVIRETLENCEDYQCAYDFLLIEPMAAPGYITVAGN
jgi:hypothetical protein